MATDSRGKAEQVGDSAAQEALALWQASAAPGAIATIQGATRVGKQLTSGAKAVIYAGLGVSAASVALGWGSWSSQSQQQTASGVLAWPAGYGLTSTSPPSF